MFEDVLVKQNKHWGGHLYPAYRKRCAFDKVRQFLPHPHVISMVGVRRAGKSTLLRQTINYLIQENGVNPKNILFLNVEHPVFVKHRKNIETLEKVWEDYFTLNAPEGLVYCLLDELQYFLDWQVFIKAHYEEKDVKFLITGSNSALLSSELMTLLSGRLLPVEVYPLSFEELADAKEIDLSDPVVRIEKKPALRRLLDEYVAYGGFPEIVFSPVKEGRYDILNAHAKSVLYEDVLPRITTKNTDEFERLFYYLLTNFGNPFSYAGLEKLFHLSDKTIKEFIAQLHAAFLILFVEKFDYSLRSQIKSPKKVYGIDTGQVNAILGNRGKLLENLVAIELKRIGFDLYYYECKNGWEVDFLAKKGLDLHLVQVTESLEEARVKEREFRALFKAMEELKLSRATVITLDEEAHFQEGSLEIEVKPAPDFFRAAY